jgi:PPOX class probable F420-dependent enzyme
MIGKPEHDAFVRKNKWAVVTTLREDGSPTNSVIFYALDGDTLFFSTTADRLKARTVRNDDRIAVSVIDEGAPYGYVTIEGTATIEEADIIPGHIEINKVMRGGEFTPPDDYAERLASQGRLLIKVTPMRVHGVVNRG